VSPRRHHVVSAGYQRHFADGELIRLWRKVSNTSKVIGVKDNFKRKGFNSAFTPDHGTIEELEDQWASIERKTLPAIQAAEQGDRSPALVQALKALVSMHYCRSYSHRDVASLTIDLLRKQGLDLSEEPSMATAFEVQFGHPPQPGEMEARFDELVSSVEASNVLFVAGMTRIYGTVMKILEPLHLQIGTPAKTDFGLILGDTPVVIQSGINVGIREGVGIGRCDMVYMPLSRWTAMSFSAEPVPDAVLSPAHVQMLNLLMWRNCKDWLAAHPCEDFPRAVGRKAPPGWPPNDHQCE
jgi:hypothetical protein